MVLFTKRYLLPLIFFVFITSTNFGQTIPYLSAPVNGSTWETTTPTLYWWYVPSPYIYGPYNYSVQVSTSSSNFTGSNLLVDASVSGYGAANYTVSGSVGLVQGSTYYWRVGINGNYSSVWGFTPAGYGGGGITTYTINSSAGLHGSITPSGSIVINSGDSRSFDITADAGYAISDVLVDGVSMGAVTNYSFDNVTSNHSIQASFSWIPVPDTTYVSLLGSDSDGDGTWAKPYRHIQRGCDKSKPGQIVYVLNGAYAEDVWLTKPLIILGQVKPSTRSFMVRANNVTIKNFACTQSSTAPGIQKVGFESYDHLDRLTLENVDAYNNAEMGLLLENIDTVVVKDCKFYGNAMGGITVVNCNYLSFSNIQLYDNLRGFAAHNCNHLTIDNLSAIDNGKGYLANYPDKNGLTFSLCNDLSLLTVSTRLNQEQGIKFADCSRINMDEISAIENGTDGIAFIECDQITFNNGAASKNGSTFNDNGIEIIACEQLNFSSVAANDNFNNGIHFHLDYYGIYIWLPDYEYDYSSLPTLYHGPTTDVIFSDISASGNGNNGLWGLHLSYMNITNPDFSNNTHSGIELDAVHHIALVNGTYDGNQIGIALRPTVNVHPLAANLSTDEITDFSLTGNGSISNNTQFGIIISPVIGTSVTAPLFYGSFDVHDNLLRGLLIERLVTNPIFSGLYFKNTAAGMGVQISDFPPQLVSGAKINDCYFQGYGPGMAINLGSAGNVDGTNNIFVGAGDNTAVEALIYHKVDLGSLGLVTTTGWTDGRPAIKIGSASAYTGSLVTIPVYFNKSASTLSFSQLSGRITFDEHKLRYKYVSYGTGTLLNDVGWGVVFDHSTTDELRLLAMGFNSIDHSGVLFTVTFEVADATDGSADVEGLALDWSNNGGSPFVVNNGTITYTASTSTSLVKGDATMDFDVDNSDYLAVGMHVAGFTLTGQAFLNADVNKDGRVDELDAADILAFVNNGVWPASATPALGTLTFATASMDQQGALRFPVTLYNSTDVRTLQVDLNYDPSKVDFRNFRQLMQGSGYYVDVKTIEKGNTRFLFTSASKNNGTLVPAELFFNLKTGDTDGLITSTYSINGAAPKAGPTYGASSVTGVEDKEVIPTTFEVKQNYPNPFNPTTTIRYALPQSSIVTIKVYDILGSLVNTLINSEMPAGNHAVIWNGDNSSGAKVGSGAYFYQVVSGSNVVTKKMLLVK